MRLGGADSADKLTPHIARLELQGVITGDDDTIDMIKKIGESSQTKALLLEIESPGGTTTGSERLYEELRRVAEKKPVVAVVASRSARTPGVTTVRQTLQLPSRPWHTVRRATPAAWSLLWA